VVSYDVASSSWRAPPGASARRGRGWRPPGSGRRGCGARCPLPPGAHTRPHLSST
jgi:hypothetical protein